MAFRRKAGVQASSTLSANLSMIDHSQRPSKQAAPPQDPPIEEARLRQQAIGVKLRHMFDQVVNEPVPDDFLDILRKADKKAEGGS